MPVHDRPFGRFLDDVESADIFRRGPRLTTTEADRHRFCAITMNLGE